LPPPAFSLPDVIIKEGLYQVNEPDLVNSCYGIFTAAGYGIYFTFEGYRFGAYKSKAIKGLSLTPKYLISLLLKIHCGITN